MGTDPKQTAPTLETAHSVRQKIVAGARSHFFAQGFRSVTMDDLANELAMSKKTLYAHFASKNALLEAVIGDKFDGLDRELGRVVLQAGADFSGALRDLLGALQRETAEVQPAFVRDIRREAPEVFQLVEKRRRQTIQGHFGKLFAQGRRAGIVRKDISVNLMIEILLGATDAIMNPIRMEELGLTPKTGFAAIIQVVLEGVIRRGGETKL